MTTPIFFQFHIACKEAEGNKVSSLADVKIEVLCKYLLTIFLSITVNILYSVQAEIPSQLER
jgi:hypothetical protein